MSAPESVIRALLEADAAVAALVGSRLYADARPEADPLPALVWSLVSDVPQPPFDLQPGLEPCVARVQCTCLAASAAQARDLAAAAVAACHLKSGTLAGVQVAYVQQATAGFSGYDALVGTYQLSVDFMVHYCR